VSEDPGQRTGGTYPWSIERSDDAERLIKLSMHTGTLTPPLAQQLASQLTLAARPRFLRLGQESDYMPDDQPSRPEVAAQIGAAEARTDTKFAQMMGRMDAGFAGVDAKFSELRGEMREGFARTDARLNALERSTSGVKATIIITAVVTGIALFGAMVGVLTYGQAGFGVGVSTRDMIRATVSEMQRNAPPAQH
jgi:hypothetical protein